MKYTDTTEEQRKNITPYLEKRLKLLHNFSGCKREFDILDPEYIVFCGVTCHTQFPDDLGLGIDLCKDCREKVIKLIAEIKAFQQAQKEEIKDLRFIAETNISAGIYRHIVEKVIKLKFESELE